MILLDKIYNSEEQRVRADKALKLNGGYAEQAASTKKPTIKIKRLSFNGQGIKLKGASSIRKDKEKALKALTLTGIGGIMLAISVILNLLPGIRRTQKD